MYYQLIWLNNFLQAKHSCNQLIVLSISLNDEYCHILRAYNLRIIEIVFPNYREYHCFDQNLAPSK
jgi:hypothetical protein